MAADHASAGLHKQLSKLELKYFGHSFESENDQHRVERLESLIFGEPTQGNISDRVAAIAQVAEKESAKDAPPAVAQNTTAADPDPDAQATPVPAKPSSPLDDELDRALSGQAPRTPIAYAQRDSDMEPVPVTAVAPVGPSAEAPGEIGNYPRVTALEQAILGHTYEGHPLTERLARMERKAFGAASTDSDLSKRTDALEKYAEQKLHKKVTAENNYGPNGGEQRQSGISQGQQIANMIGRTLLGVAGIRTGGVGSSTAGAPGYGPFGGPAFGPNLGPGFGRRSRMQQQQQQPPPKEPEPEDPGVLAVNPPPAQARVLTKVGWCEMRVFGQTFRTMHLPERLTQLNQQLHFCPGRSGVDLMDHVNDLMKAAIATRPAARPMASDSDND